MGQQVQTVVYLQLEISLVPRLSPYFLSGQGESLQKRLTRDLVVSPKVGVAEDQDIQPGCTLYHGSTWLYHTDPTRPKL